MNRFIPTTTHAVIGYVMGILVLLAPNIFGFADIGGAAVMIPRIVGIVLLLSESTTDNGLSLVGLIPMRPHLMMDILAGIFLAASPWLWGFHDQGTNAWLTLLVAGLAYAAVSLSTQTEPSRGGRRVHV
jgi:hypothetical protein